MAVVVDSSLESGNSAGRDSRLTISASVPGNLLLFGEYAVTLSGGLGIALGVEPRVTGIVEEAPSFSILGRSGRAFFHWPEDPSSVAGPRESANASASPPALLPSLLRVAAEAAEFDVGRLSSLPYRITVDSSALHRNDGSKRGLGSSAAVSVLLSGMLLRLFRGKTPEREEVFRVALCAHRMSQGGRGSGYDVAASCFGGLGLFKGGEDPTWREFRDSWIPPLRLFPGPSAVATAPAIGNFERWRKEEPEAFDSFFAASNAGVESLASATDWAAAAPIAARLGELARDLGRRIGVPADLPERLVTCLEKENRSSLEPQPTTIKAVGAGGELFVSFGHVEERNCPEGQDIRITEGLRWHT